MAGVILIADAGRISTGLRSSVSQKSALRMVIAVAAVTYLAAAYAGLWVAPQALRTSTPQAYAQFAGGSVLGIQAYAVAWTLWSAGSLAYVLRRVKNSDAWGRVGRHRFVSIVGNALMAAGLVGFGSFVLPLEVSLAAEHALMSRYQDTAAFAGSTGLWLAACCAIAMALLIGAVGATVDLIVGKAPLRPT